MAVATSKSAFSPMSKTRPKPLAKPFSENNSTAQNNKQTTAKKAPDSSSGSSFLFGVYSDVAKTLWKILSGAMVTEVVRGVLKTDKRFSLAKIIDKAFRVDFISRFVGDFGGALTVRLFSGKTKFFGLKIPKIHTAISSQLFTNLWVKFWRTMSASDNLNKLAADGNDNEAAKLAIESMEKTAWFSKLKSMNNFYKETLSPRISWFFSKIFGIKGGVKDADGKEGEPSVNWLHFGAVAAGSGIATWLLPNDTQIFGFEDVNKSKGAMKTFLNSALTWGLTSLVRLENYLFNNAVTLQPKGYGFDACMKIAVREKGFIPMAQYACDTVAAILSKYTPINGAFLSSIIRLPIEIVTTFLTASLIGVSKKNRVEDKWILLADKVMKPIAKSVEKVVTPVFSVLRSSLYRLIGFFDPALEGKTLPYEEDKTRLPVDREEALYKKAGHRSLLKLFLKSTLVDWWTSDLWSALSKSMNGGAAKVPPAKGPGSPKDLAEKPKIQEKTVPEKSEAASGETASKEKQDKEPLVEEAKPKKEEPVEEIKKDDPEAKSA